MQTGFAGGLNVYRVMAHHPALLKSWASLRAHVVQGNTLNSRQLEFVILRIGHRWASAYEWAHHVVRGRAAGLTERDIELARSPASAWPAASLEAALMGAVDQLLDDGMLSPDMLQGLIDRIGVAGVMDIMATVGMYSTLAFIVKTFDTPLDSGVAPDGPPSAVK